MLLINTYQRTITNSNNTFPIYHEILVSWNKKYNAYAYYTTYYKAAFY